MRTGKAVFGMGCFWGPDALFGAEKGVIRTKVGYSGGSKKNPDYHSLGDHTEVVMVEYDPEETSYSDLLEIFWENHDYSSRRKKQYRSIILYITEDQKRLANTSIESQDGKVETTIQPLEQFYDAEDYHQKYRLRHSALFSDLEEFEDLSPEEFRDSSLAAKANAVAAGYLDREELEKFRS